VVSRPKHVANTFTAIFLASGATIGTIFTFVGGRPLRAGPAFFTMATAFIIGFVSFLVACRYFGTSRSLKAMQAHSA
jgi:hypothetical protein